MLPVLLIAGIAIAILPALLTKVSLGIISFDANTANIASTIGSIVGPILNFFTLALVLGSFFLDSREKSLRLSFNLIEKLTNIYGGILSEYERVGRLRQWYGSNGQLNVGIIFPYLQRITPLFKEVVTRLKTGNSLDSQYRALVSILRSQVEPMVEVMLEEATRLDRGVDIAQEQLESLRSL